MKLKRIFIAMLVAMLALTGVVGSAPLMTESVLAAARISDEKLELEVGKTHKLKVSGMKKAKWSSSDKSVATVNKKGKVTAVGEGTAVITAKKGKKSVSCEVKVTASNTTPEPGGPSGTGFNAAKDMTVTKGQTEIYIEFTVSKDNPLTKEEAAECGLTLSEDGNTASGTVPCATATYSFTKLPGNLEELKTIPLDNMFGPMAAAIAAVASYEPGKYTMQNHTELPLFAEMDYLNGPVHEISNVAKSSMYTVIRNTLEGYGGAAQGSPFMYFDGATPANAYKPNEPYTFTLVHGPYQVPEHQSIATGQMEPARQMILISFAGDDSQRYCDVWNSPSTGNWYIWDDSWQHLVAGAKPAAIQW